MPSFRTAMYGLSTPHGRQVLITLLEILPIDKLIIGSTGSDYANISPIFEDTPIHHRQTPCSPLLAEDPIAVYTTRPAYIFSLLCFCLGG
jgi:hypothetical protein